MIYYVNLKHPWRKIRIIEDARIFQGEKLTWAVDQHGKKRLLGSSAFQTLHAADMARMSRLILLVKPVVKHMAPKAWEAATNTLVSDYNFKWHHGYLKGPQQ